MLNTKSIRAASIVFGVAAIGFIVFAGVQVRRANQSQTETRQTRDQIVTIQKRIEESKGQKLAKDATAPAAPNEEANFIAQLKSTAKDTKVTIVKWALVASQNRGDARKKSTAVDAKSKSLLEGVTPIAGSLEIEGDYKSVLRFSDRLLSADRLINLSFISLARDDEKNVTRMSMLITRYVENPLEVVKEEQKV